jgi:hypothetical protein
MSKKERKEQRALRKLKVHRYNGRIEALYGEMTPVDALLLVDMGFRLKGNWLEWNKSKVERGVMSTGACWFDIPKKDLLNLVRDDNPQSRGNAK